MPLSPGTKLGPYEIVALLGAGGMGEVYRARDARLGRDVAVKVLQESLGGNAWERFEREARAASALNHPNICAVHDVGEADGRPYLVMELVEGQTLRDYTGRQPVEPAVVIALGAQIADALEAAHAKGIIHRDIKAGNIMVTGRRHVKVLDFGLAKHAAVAAEAADTRTMQPLTAAGTIVGTPHYMAPEILQGKPADARSDLWALGVVLHEMLTGRLPFQGSTPFEVSSGILREAPPPLPAGVPSGLRTIVERSLEKRPEQRYQTAGDVRAALETLQAAAMPRRKTWLWVAGIAALVIAGALFLYQRQPPSEGRRTSTGAPASAKEDANLAFESAEKFYYQGDIARSQESYSRALALDSGFTEARSRLAFSYAMQILRGQSNDSNLLYTAEEELRKASKENPDLPNVHAGFAAVYFLTGRKDRMPAEVDPALKRDPSAIELLMWRVQYLVYTEDNNAAKKQIRSMLDRDPAYQPARFVLGDILRREGDIEGAIREQQRVLDQVPGNTTSVRFLALAFMDSGQLERARKLLEEKRGAMEHNYLWRHARALLLALEGKQQEALSSMDEATLKFAEIQILTTLETAEFYALVGDRAKAFNWLDRAVRNGDERIEWFRKDPRLESIRDDPSFQRIIDSIEARRKQR